MSDDLNKIVPEDVNPVQEQSPATGEAPVIEEKVEETIAEAPVEEAPAAEPEKEIDFSGKSLKELVDSLKEYVENEDIRSLNKYAEVIKACFYKTLKKDKIEMGFDEVAAKDVVLEQAEAPAEAPAEASAAESEAPAAEAPEQDNTASTNPFAEIERGFKALYGKYRTLRTEFMNEQNAKRDENFDEKSKILQELKSLVENPGDLGKAYPKFRELQNNWRAIGAVPPAKAKDLYDSYHHNVEVFYDFVKMWASKVDSFIE